MSNKYMEPRRTRNNIHMFLKDFFCKNKTRPWYQSLKIISIYFLIGCLWILFSDRLVRLYFQNPNEVLVASIVKGGFYVLITSILFFVLIYDALRRVYLSKKRTDQLNFQLEKSNTLFSAILESSPDIIVFSLDRQYSYTAFNKRHKETMLQLWGKEITIGADILEIIDIPDDRHKAKINFDRALAGEHFSVEEEYGNEKYERLYWQNYYSPITSKDGEVVGATCFSLNITLMKKAEEENRFLSYHDKLTGLYNRRYYENALLRMDEAKNYPISIIMGDLNGLKLVNDAFGHHTGDALLKQAAQTIADVCRPEDTVARWGGDEFIILLPKTTTEEAEDFILHAKERCSGIKVNSINLDISFGWGTKSAPNVDINEVLRNAENLMYSQKMTESKSMRSQTINTIMRSLHEKNPREEEHSKRVGDICQKIGIAMGLSEIQTKTLYLAGYLHDIGKIAIEENILNKPGKLTAQEFEIIKKHPEIGCRIIRSSYEISEIAEAILAHHERWDGTGYPKGLKDNEIPVYSRIIMIADSYDAMISKRPYKKVISKSDAKMEICKCSGKQFDPELSRIFIEICLDN